MRRIWFTGLLLWACSSSPDDSATPAPGGAGASPGTGAAGATQDAGSDKATQLIGVDGGLLEGPAGAHVVLPSGALPRDVLIGLERTPGVVPPPGMLAAGSPIGLTPYGTSFSTPAAMRIPASAGATLVGKLDDPSDTTWEFLYDVGHGYPGLLTLPAEQAGIYMAFLPDPEAEEVACPCDPASMFPCPSCKPNASCHNEAIPITVCPALQALPLSSTVHSKHMASSSRMPCSLPNGDPLAGCFVGKVTSSSDVQVHMRLLGQTLCGGSNTDDEGFYIAVIGCGPSSAAILGGNGTYDIRPLPSPPQSRTQFPLTENQTFCARSGPTPRPNRDWLTLTSDGGGEIDWAGLQNFAYSEPSNTDQLFYVAQCGCQANDVAFCLNNVGQHLHGALAAGNLGSVLTSIVQVYNGKHALVDEGLE